MDLATFLETASPDDATALQEARQYEEVVYSLTSSEAVALLLVQNGLYGPLHDASEDPNNPARGICLAFMDSVRAESTFNWSDNTEKGLANRAMIDNLIQLLPDLEDNLNAFKADADAEASETVKPFARVTLHDVMLSRGTCPVKPVAQSGGYAVIETIGPTEKHNPRLLAENPRTGKRVRIESFRGVSEAGKYDTKVPPEWRNASLFVDDAYGVI